MVERERTDVGGGSLPLDPDVDASEIVGHRRRVDAGPFEHSRPGRWPRLQAPVLVAVFAGGVGGGLARYGVTQAWPASTRAFPWGIFVVNTTGAFALALLLVVLAEVWAPHRDVRRLDARLCRLLATATPTAVDSGVRWPGQWRWQLLSPRPSPRGPPRGSVDLVPRRSGERREALT